jgi:protein TonB
VVAKFVVEKDGSISTIEILKGLGHGCDEETVRVIKAMPKWKPDIHKKNAIRTYYTIPVNFLVTS